MTVYQFEKIIRANPPRNAVIKLTKNDLLIESEICQPSKAFIDEICSQMYKIKFPTRFILCHGFFDVIKKQIPNITDFGKIQELKRFHALTCRAVFNRLCDRRMQFFEKDIINPFNPLGVEVEHINFEVDGFNINPNFQGQYDFYSTKKLHFDIVEPMGSNLYLPTSNLTGGFPVFADAHSYCTQENIDIVDILIKIPGTRILTIKEPHYQSILNNFSVTYEFNTEQNPLFTIFTNSVRETGLLHGSTDSKKINLNEPAVRWLVHYSADNSIKKVTEQWYANLCQTPDPFLGEYQELKHKRSSNHRIDGCTNLVVTIGNG